MEPLKDEIMKMREELAIKNDHELLGLFNIPTVHIVDFLGGDSPTNGGLYMKIYMSKIFKMGMEGLRKPFKAFQNHNIKKEYSRVYYA